MEYLNSKPSGVLTQDVIDMMDLKLRQVKKYASLDPSNGWQLESDKNGLKIHTRYDNSSGCRWVRGEAVINGTPDDVERVLYSPTNEADYDDTRAESKTIEEISGYYFHYFRSKRPNFLVSPRDLVTCSRWIKEGETTYCFGASIKHPQMPDRPDLVRAEVLIWGYVLQPLLIDTNKTNVTYILGTDAKGSLPKPIVNLFISKQAYGLLKIRDWIDKHPKQ